MLDGSPFVGLKAVSGVLSANATRDLLGTET